MVLPLIVTGKMNPVMIASDNDEIDESDVRTLQENCDGDIGESDVQNKLVCSIYYVAAACTLVYA